MRKEIEKALKSCNECNQNKAARHAPYGHMQSPRTPEKAWQSIAWDFIIKLPLSKELITGVEYDAILVIID